MFSNSQSLGRPSDILRELVLESLPTEQRNPASENIDALPTAELLRIINREDHEIAQAVEKEISQIAEAVDAVVERFQRGGRLFYVGAGTSGRIGVLDAAECPPTFGVSPDRVQALIAGGEGAVFRAREGAEDDPAAAKADLKARAVCERDVVVGVSAGGQTPYVLGAVAYAGSIEASTIGVSCNPRSKLADQVDFAITPVVGPEVITGSTRMKAGTAQKLVLNMISTGVMVRMGYVLGNLMVNVQLKSEKLRRRGQRIVAEVAGCGKEEAARALAASNGHVRTALLMAKFGVDRQAAETMLQNAGDNLWKALRAKTS